VSYGKGRVFSDIGCYTLGALAPYDAINTCVDMGASITMAKGAADVGLVPAVAVIGDSTFTHSGITGLLDAVNDKVNITVIIPTMPLPA
jgi:indolepyruvate ferredoxin oxidoreductase, alpha subunit